MAVIFTGEFKATKIGRQILLDVQLDRSGGPLSDNGFAIDATGCLAIESALLAAGGGNIDETGYVSGTAVLVPDGNYAGRVHGHASWDRQNGTIDINFPSWSCTSSAQVAARFVLFSDAS
jgi:hypothetical protein